MTTPAPARRRHRSRPAAAPSSTMAADRTGPDAMLPPLDDEAAQLSSEWRAGVSRQMDNTARILQQVQVGMERLNAHMEEQNKRIERLEQAPAQRRAEKRADITLDYRFWTIMIAACALVVSIFHPTIVFH